ncbi:MAG: YeeE/YedE thiosulfate transporter family protein [Bdellovibrionota bacterium]|nr:YeeE/YedE thiosulfate transporter family protein [Bdellovibrionota bacterium]
MINALIGGAIIGLAASLLLLTLGRIFGITGIMSGMFSGFNKSNIWQYMIVLGLILGSAITSIFMPQFFQYEFKTSLPLMALAGFLVGYGTRLGSGCTSGHGVCGLPRLSIRSFVATMTFMTSGIVTVFIMGRF